MSRPRSVSRATRTVLKASTRAVNPCGGTAIPYRITAVYEPAGHEGVLNRLLAGRELGTEQVSVWHGTLEPGGGSDTHVHADAAQVYIGLSGPCTVTVGAATHDLGPLTAVTIAPGQPHRIHNHGGEEATLLVVSAPALR